jgi:hydrogenase maturation protein HypF
VSGIVQGVGFRPFVRNLAVHANLAGFVRNVNGIVEIEVEGADEAITKFIQDLQNCAPPLSAIQSLQTRTVDCQPENISLEGDAAISTNSRMQPTFEIRHSTDRSSPFQRFISADAATCSHCLSELFDETDRRYRYPFINCTNCGPRFTIISALPYDRPHTTMAQFTMCQRCQSEYDDPDDRRYHAQPNACSDCGPQLSFTRSGSATTCGAEALGDTVALWQRSGIVAVKGLGGFHLMCDASDSRAVIELRRRKGREHKPLAVMMQDLEMVRRYCHCSAREADELSSVARPIVLLKKRESIDLADQLSPAIDHLGVMLPYTPLHHLLMSDFKRPIVATSANRSEEPIAIDNEEAIEKLYDICDAFLLHNRPIKCRYDDSVVQIVQDRQSMIRRSRGFAPLAIKVPLSSQSTVLACGAHLKNTFCLLRGDQAFVSQHIGDMENLETIQYFEELVRIYKDLFDLEPQVIAHDLHPDYSSTRLAQDLASKYAIRMIPVQHHFAHIVSCMAEHQIKETTIGVAFDGIGFGDDQTLWGGEFFLADWRQYRRVAHLEAVPMPGGSQAIKHPWRMALGYIFNAPAHVDCFSSLIEELQASYGAQSIHTIQRQIQQSFNAPLTSSCGRLFDAMAAILGLRQSVTYEAQAAMELESVAGIGADERRAGDIYPYESVEETGKTIIKVSSILAEAYRERVRGLPITLIAAKFHYTIADLIAKTCLSLKDESGIATVCLAGGVFQNKLLLRLCCEQLEQAEFQVFFSQRVPANDGGISLGQAVAAAAIENYEVKQ